MYRICWESDLNLQTTHSHHPWRFIRSDSYSKQIRKVQGLQLTTHTGDDTSLSMIPFTFLRSVNSLYHIETAMFVVKGKGQKSVRKRVCPLKKEKRRNKGTGSKFESRRDLNGSMKSESQKAAIHISSFSADIHIYHDTFSTSKPTCMTSYKLLNTI